MIKTIKGTLSSSERPRGFERKTSIRRRKRRKGWTKVPEGGRPSVQGERERVDLESGVKDGVKMEGEKYGWDGVTGIPTPDIRSTLLLGRSGGNNRGGAAIPFPNFVSPRRVLPTF